MPTITPGFAIYIGANILLELLLIRTMCRVLSMRSNAAFALATLVFLAAGIATSTIETHLALRALLLTVPKAILLPFVLSRGPKRTRIARIAIVNIGLATCEAIAFALHELLYGNPFPESLVELPVSEAISMYTLVLLIQILESEAIIYACSGIDRETIIGLELPVIILDSVMFVGFMFLLPHIHRHVSSTGEKSLVFLLANLCVLLTMALSIAAASIARKAWLTKRDKAIRDARAQKLRQLYFEIGNTEQQRRRLQQVRHDLANQVETAVGLALQGRADEADHHLAALQDQARIISGTYNAHE